MEKLEKAARISGRLVRTFRGKEPDAGLELESSSGLTGVEQRQVFHDHVDQHFSSITVDAYKRLQGLEITKLSIINLFAGINNSGKTSLLEAVYLLARQNDFNGLVEVIRHRGKVPRDQTDPEWLMRQISDEIRISGIFKWPTRQCLNP